MAAPTSLARNPRVSYHRSVTSAPAEAVSWLGKVLRSLRNVNLWPGIAFGIVLLCLYDGAGYAIGGNKVAAGPSLYFLRHFMPGGMHVYGYIELVLGIAVLYTIHDRPKGARWAMLAVFVYSIMFSSAVIWGWHVSGEVTWGGPSKWFFVGWIALWLGAKTEQREGVSENEG